MTPLSKTLRLFSALLLTTAILSGCTKKAPPAAKSPVLIVNGEALIATDFAKSLARQLKKFDALAAKDPAIIRKAKEAVIREFIVSTLLRQYATSKDLVVTQQDIDIEIDRVRKTYPDDFTFKTALATEGLSIDEWRERITKSLLEKKVFKVIDNSTGTQQKDLEADAQKFYEEHKSEFIRPAQVHLQQIVVTKEDDAQRLMKKIREGTPMSDLAKRFSISPDGAEGGDIGYVSKGTTPAFDTAFNMRKGQLSGVIKSNYGFHVIKVLDKRDQTRQSFDQVKKRLMMRLAMERQQEGFQKWLETEIKKAKVERNDSLLETMKIHTEDAQK
ncbi:MAG: peptidyl-prolyl cis-trans isomerase [Oligoflexia bacterium]|nr:peptidyl-prolyl cis-trans isomerase [Oligoflexia bacterium]